MKKGKVRLAIGAVLMGMQVLSFIGNGGRDLGVRFTAESFLFDLGFMIGYCLVGIIGVIVFVSGLIAYRRSRETAAYDQNVLQEETPIAVPRYCRYCGVSLSETDRFCTACGTQVINTEENRYEV